MAEKSIVHLSVLWGNKYNKKILILYNWRIRESVLMLQKET